MDGADARPDVLLEVTVHHERDVPGAQEGGADRLHLEQVDAEGANPGSPPPEVVSAVCRESDVPVFVLLRLNDSWTTTGGELTRLVGLAHDYAAAGVAGVTFGFLDSDLGVDVEVCTHLAQSLPGLPWAFHRGFDAALETRRAWRAVLGLPGLVTVHTAGSPRGMAAGYDDLLAAVDADPEVARLAMPSGGLAAEQVPWLLRAGVRQLHLDTQARPGGSHRSFVDAGHVRSWRLLVDDAARRVG